MKEQENYCLILPRPLLEHISKHLRWDFEDYDTCMDKRSASLALACGDAHLAIVSSLNSGQVIIDLRKGEQTK